MNKGSEKRAGRLRRRIGTVAAAAMILTLFSLHSCATMRSSPEEIETLLESSEAGSFRTAKDGERTVAWIEAGARRGPLVVFVHGSPGSLSAFASFFKEPGLLTRARLASIDRLGFGYSGLGDPEPSLVRQASAVATVIDAMPDNRPVILVGHSYGGPVIARLAIDRPDLADGLVLVAPSIDPDLEPKHWFQRPLASPLLRWIVPRPLRASNEEILGLEPELRAMLPMWGTIDIPVTVIQGGKDGLVPPGNADFARRMLVGTDVEVVYVEDMNHFVPWSNPELIRRAVLQQLDSVVGSQKEGSSLSPSSF